MLKKGPKGSNFIELYKIDAVMGAKAARKKEIQIFNSALDPCGNLFDLTAGGRQPEGGNAANSCNPHKWRKLRPPCLEESVTVVPGKVRNGMIASFSLICDGVTDPVRPDPLRTRLIVAKLFPSN
jgi:hypothetical protein